MYNIPTDNYKEHEQHIRGADGKRIPFFRNEKTCSTCSSERQKILRGREKYVPNGRGWVYEPKEYEINA